MKLFVNEDNQSVIFHSSPVKKTNKTIIIKTDELKMKDIVDTEISVVTKQLQNGECDLFNGGSIIDSQISTENVSEAGSVSDMDEIRLRLSDDEDDEQTAITVEIDKIESNSKSNLKNEVSDNNEKLLNLENVDNTTTEENELSNTSISKVKSSLENIENNLYLEKNKKTENNENAINNDSTESDKLEDLCSNKKLTDKNQKESTEENNLNGNQFSKENSVHDIISNIDEILNENCEDKNKALEETKPFGSNFLNTADSVDEKNLNKDKQIADNVILNKENFSRDKNAVVNVICEEENLNNDKDTVDDIGKEENLVKDIDTVDDSICKEGNIIEDKGTADDSVCKEGNVIKDKDTVDDSICEKGIFINDKDTVDDAISNEENVCKGKETVDYVCGEENLNKDKNTVDGVIDEEENLIKDEETDDIISNDENFDKDNAMSDDENLIEYSDMNDDVEIDIKDNFNLDYVLKDNLGTTKENELLNSKKLEPSSLVGITENKRKRSLDEDRTELLLVNAETDRTENIKKLLLDENKSSSVSNIDTENNKRLFDDEPKSSDENIENVDNDTLLMNTGNDKKRPMEDIDNMHKYKRLKKSDLDEDIKIPNNEKIEFKFDIKKVEPKVLKLKLLSMFLENGKIDSDTMDVEDFIVTKIIETFTQKTENSKLKENLETQVALCEQFRQKNNHLTKQLRDIEVVYERLQQDMKMKDHPVAPVKITRSVGLQVTLPPFLPRRSSNLSQADNTKRKVAKPNTNIEQITNNNVNKPSTVVTTQINTQTPVQTNSPILSKAIQAKPVKQNSTSPTARKSISTSPNPASEKPVIDLTDEDDNKSNNTPKPSATLKVQTVNPTIHVVCTQQLGITTTAMPLNTMAGTPLRLVVPQAAPGTRPVFIRPPTGVVQHALLFKNGTTLIPTTATQYSNQNLPRSNIIITNGQASTQAAVIPARRIRMPQTHPAPPPNAPTLQQHIRGWKQIPPQPHLKITERPGGFQLSWSMPDLNLQHADIASYQIFAYQEFPGPPNTDNWRKVGDVKALPLPMACTLNSFQKGYNYYFAVRALDIHSRFSLFSLPQKISLGKNK